MILCCIYFSSLYCICISANKRHIKRYGDALVQVISLQPEEVTDLPAYFRGVEEQFKKLNVPRKISGSIDL